MFSFLALVAAAVHSFPSSLTSGPFYFKESTFDTSSPVALTQSSGFGLEASTSACSTVFPNSFAFRVTSSSYAGSICLDYATGAMRLESQSVTIDPTAQTHAQFDYLQGLESYLTAANAVNNAAIAKFMQSAINEQISKVAGVVAPVQKLKNLILQNSKTSATFKIYSNQDLELIAQFNDKLSTSVYGNKRLAVSKGINTVTLDLLTPPVMGPFTFAFSVVKPGNDILNYFDIGAYPVTIFRTGE